MTSSMDWGVQVILWLQQFSPTLDPFFKAVSFLGEEDFLLLLLALLYWCLNRRLGARLTILTMGSAYISGLAKLLANQPRPFQYDTRVKQLTDVVGGGFPSLHTQFAVVIWGYLAAQVRRTWMWVLAIVFIVLIPLSRLYLGVHFPADLLGGYILGAITLLLYLRFEPPVEAWLARKGLAWQLVLAVLIPLLMLLILPSPDEITVTSIGLLWGASIGFALERRWVRFESGGKVWKQAVRFLVGVAIVLALRFGLKAAFDGLQPEMAFRVVRYAIMGLWFAAGAPWLFVAMGLAKRQA